MKLTRRKALALYDKRDRNLMGITGAIHPYEVVEDETAKSDGPKTIVFFIMTHDNEAPVIIRCEDSLNLSQIAGVREKAIAIAKELSVGYYMENGDEDMR